MTSIAMIEPSRRNDAASFTDREIQVLALVAAGDTSAAIARRLGIAPNTVKSHLNSIYKKIQVTDRVQATRYFLVHYTPHQDGVPQVARRPAEISPIQLQIRDIHLRLEQLGHAGEEALRLRHALHALRALSARPISTPRP